MGHYASEMQCDDCGKLSCVCVRKHDQPNKNWIVDDDFSVIKVCDFDVKYAKRKVECRWGTVEQDGMPMLRRMGRQEFKKRADAELHARELCEKAVENARTKLLALKKICVTERPWEEDRTEKLATKRNK